MRFKALIQPACLHRDEARAVARTLALLHRPVTPTWFPVRFSLLLSFARVTYALTDTWFTRARVSRPPNER